MDYEKFEMPHRDIPVKVDENLHETRRHGSIEYPIALYQINVKKLHMEIVPWHWHEELEFIYVIEGHGEFLVSDHSIFLEKGQGLLINADILHAFHLISDEENCIFISICFHPSFVVSQTYPEMWTKYILPILKNPDFLYLSLANLPEKYQEILEHAMVIYQLNKEKQFGYELYTKGYLLQLWMLLLKYAALDHPASHKRQSSQISMDEARTKDAIQYMKEHYAEPISLDDIADSVHISKSECCRCIKRCMNMTPFEYLMKFRILTAAEIIASSNDPLSLSDLAVSVGFNSSSYFSKLFRKYMGCTPSQYKKKQIPV